jgi:hypothetical protein
VFLRCLTIPVIMNCTCSENASNLFIPSLDLLLVLLSTSFSSFPLLPSFLPCFLPCLYSRSYFEISSPVNRTLPPIQSLSPGSPKTYVTY